MKTEQVQTDITVVGGGLAGVCAAVAAARLGRTVALVQNRPVLGGNASSEVRVWVCGATGHGTNRYARETGIMGEMFVENQYRNPDGNPYLWDLVVLETVRAEPNIQLFLNTDVHEVEAEGEESNREIRSVTGWMMGSERRIRFESKMYLDCTGDGLVGFLAGAKYRIGREARHEYNEEWAPEVADDITLGSTILFYTKDAGHPVKFVPPGFAKDITETSIPIRRVIRSGDSGCHYWWIEWGGELDTVHDNERIRDELWSVIYGIWDYIKNSGKFDADTMTLEWVGSIPGKREYRRFLGDYVLNQNDIIAQREFEDRIAFGGWSIDLHPPKGMYAEESGSKHMHADGIYHIPFRSLYSANVSNLMFAGRDISATHVAFGTTRVMATCAVIGEAAGSGAALSVEKGITPRQLHSDHMKQLQQVMLRQDASIIGLHNEDANDLARTASVSASSVYKTLRVENGKETYRLTQDVGILVPVEPRLDVIELLIDAAEPTVLEAELWDTGRKENYVPANKRTEARVEVPAGTKQWVRFEVPWTPDEPANAFIIIKANENIHLYLSDIPVFGVLSFEKRAKPNAAKTLEDHDDLQPVVLWSMKSLVREPFCFRMYPETTAYSEEKLIDGYVRPYGTPHLWMSEPMKAGTEEWVQLEWDRSRAVRQVHITFNDDVNEDLINLHHHRTPFDIIPELVKDYRVEAKVNGEWVVLVSVKDNRKRKRLHRLDEPVQSDRIRLVVESTNGSPFAQAVEMRVYV
ncbi:FAD-dependent oxidoreductase [Paenibacillus alkalitolerans]|uniref:FAD-dependent oxidoreductase n=1 Tax=Paenibacillus alkalitolerans TaxID=2799335 RepID=UPI0018F458C4|nr:FAD-dependent oxidoreductase [Paenibacillus alkalitolerans]